MKTKLNEDLKSAIKEKNSLKVNTIRNIISEITKVEKTNGKEIDSDRVSQIIKKLYVQRIDSAKIFKDSGRMDLYEKENSESVVLKNYLPEELSEEKQKEIVDKILAENNLKPNEIGKIMKLLPQILDKKMVSDYLKTL